MCLAGFASLKLAPQPHTKSPEIFASKTGITCEVLMSEEERETEGDFDQFDFCDFCFTLFHQEAFHGSLIAVKSNPASTPPVQTEPIYLALNNLRI